MHDIYENDGINSSRLHNEEVTRLLRNLKFPGWSPDKLRTSDDPQSFAHLPCLGQLAPVRRMRVVEAYLNQE